MGMAGTILQSLANAGNFAGHFMDTMKAKKAGGSMMPASSPGDNLNLGNYGDKLQSPINNDPYQPPYTLSVMDKKPKSGLLSRF